MERYETYFELLFAGGSAVAGLALWALLGALFLCGIGLWLPLTLRGEGQPKGEGRVSPAEDEKFGGGPFGDWISLLPVAMAGGLASAVMAWTFSLFVFRNFWPGNAILILAGLVGIALAWKARKDNPRKGFTLALSHPVAVTLVTLFAFFLGLWHHAATELPVTQDVPRLVFSDLQRDLGAHVQMAGLVRDGGLPMQNLWGAPDHEYWSLSHTGHLILISGFSQLLGVSLYQASSILWIAATLLIAWAALGLFAGTRIPGAARFMLALGTLVWGAFSFPELHRLYDPVRESAAGGFELDAPGFWISGRGFWNLPQTLSISLTLAALVLTEAFASARRQGRAGSTLLATAACLAVVGGWTKPSLIIFYGPAFVLWLAINRASIRDYACVLIPGVVGAFVYAIPALFFDLPEAPGWTLHPSAEQSAAVGGFILMAGPALGVVAMAGGLRLVREGGRNSNFRVLDLALLAAGGSVLFALLFREDQFVGFRVFQPNIWWGMSACIILLVPLLGREAFAQLQLGGWRRRVAGLGLGLGFLHVFNGACLAVAYPTLNLRGHARSDAEVMASARARTPPGTRFALDPSLQDYDLVSYLSRPAIMPTGTFSRSNQRDFEAWQSFVLEFQYPEPALLERFDALLFRQDRRHIAGFLASHGWQREFQTAEYALWRRGRSPAPRP